MILSQLRNQLFFLSLFIFSTINILAQTTPTNTVVNGIVLDAQTSEPLAFATVVFEGTSIGATTNFDGEFTLETTDPSLATISVSYLGYQEKTMPIKPGETQTVELLLNSNDKQLEEFVVKRKRRAPKDTAAITLYRRIVRNRDNNTSSKYDYYSYEDYTKMEFDLYNIKEKLTTRRILKPFDFIFENIDTTENGTPYLPVLFKERIADVYYRKKPRKLTEVVKADQFSGIEDMEVSEMADYTLTDIDVYQNVMVINGKGFISPFAKGAIASYKYFLSDSTMIDDQWCYKLEFTPRRKQDLCFNGHAWIHDETAAVKSIEMELLNQVNLNYVNELKIKQGFTFLNRKQWFKNYDQMEVTLNITQRKQNQSVRLLRTSSRKNIGINTPIEELIFKGDATVIQAEAYNRSAEFWKDSRHKKLTNTENGIYGMVERVQATKAYKNYKWLGHLGATAFFKVGKYEIGKYYQMVSYNAIEGMRFRFGGRTHRKEFSEKLNLEGYVAYGTRDKFFKYYGGLRYHLPRKNNKWHMIGAHYRYDWSHYNFTSPWSTHDKMMNSIFRSSPLDNLFLIRQAHLFYEKEWIRGFMNRFSTTHKTVYSWPGAYDISLPGEGGADDQFEVFELHAYARFNLGRKLLSRAMKNAQADFSTPSVEIGYTTSVKGLLGSDYNYHKITSTIKQRVNTGIGRTDLRISGGKIFGRVPFPLLQIHRGNETFYYDNWAYNLMNDSEFANDMWASFWVRHKFEGLIFNAIPLVRKLKFRSMVYFKGVTGSLSKDNLAYLETSNGIKDLNGYYAETGVGIENIAKVISASFMWRLTQRNDPNVMKWGIKFAFDPSF